MQSFFEDLKFGLRLLRKNPAASLIGALTLAIGIASCTTVFSWVDGVLVHPFRGASDQGRLAVMEMIRQGAPNGATQASLLDYRDYRDRMRTISGLAAYHEDVFSLGSGTDAQPVWGEVVSSNYFTVLGLPFEAGRGFQIEGGSETGGVPAIVISYRLWDSYFQKDPRVVGKKIRVNRQDLEVAGVTPPEFNGTQPGLLTEIWVPISVAPTLGMLDKSIYDNRANRNIYLLARLAPGATVQEAAAEAAGMAGRLEQEYPNTNKRIGATVLPLWKSHMGPPQLLLDPLRILSAAALLVFLIACANTANLLLARSVSRSKEFGVRISLGAGRWRLARQVLTETLILGGAGVLAGWPLTLWMADLLPSLVPKVGVSVSLGLHPNLRLLSFAMLACIVSALIAGVAPALFATRSDVHESLKSGLRGGSPSMKSHALRGMLVVGEVALASVALIGAGLFTRSLWNAREIDPGFDSSNLQLARFYMASSGYTSEETRSFSSRLTARLKVSPGIAEASYVDMAPLGSGAGPYSGVQVDGYTPSQGESMLISRNLISPGHFSVMKTPMVEGREFTDADNSAAVPVIVVNEAFARRYFGGANPIGRRVKCMGDWRTVVGVVKDFRTFSLTEPIRPHFFAPLQQYCPAGAQLYFLIRPKKEPEPALAAFRREAASVGPNAGAYFTMSLRDYTDVTMLPLKVASSLVAGLGLLALALAASGLYSVMAYAVTQRTGEIGIRLAIGARPWNVLTDVLGRGMVLAAAGLVAGWIAAFAMMRLAGSLLVNVSASDPAVFVLAGFFLALVALMATLVPAWRASRVAPMNALRSE
jgi:predicted permease